MKDYEEIQKKTLSEYMSLFERPTIVNLANDSQIQKTRVFRLINGLDMRLSEYLILKDRINSLSNSRGSLESLARKCDLLLKPSQVSDLTIEMSRKLRQNKLEQNIADYSTAA